MLRSTELVLNISATQMFGPPKNPVSNHLSVCKILIINGRCFRRLSLGCVNCQASYFGGAEHSPKNLGFDSETVRSNNGLRADSIFSW